MNYRFRIAAFIAAMTSIGTSVFGQAAGAYKAGSAEALRLRTSNTDFALAYQAEQERIEHLLDLLQTQHGIYGHEPTPEQKNSLLEQMNMQLARVYGSRLATLNRAYKEQYESVRGSSQFKKHRRAKIAAQHRAQIKFLKKSILASQIEKPFEMTKESAGWLVGKVLQIIDQHLALVRRDDVDGTVIALDVTSTGKMFPKDTISLICAPVGSYEYVTAARTRNKALKVRALNVTHRTVADDFWKQQPQWQIE